MIGPIDPVLHAPARLQIAATLARVDDAEFTLLKDIAAVSDSVLSKHLAALGEAGYIKITKAARDGRQRTSAAMTGKGRKAFAAHMRTLQAMVDAAQQAAGQR